MPRKKKQLSATEAYEAAFPSRLRNLMRRTDTTQAALAAHLGIARQSCAAYCDGSSSPTWEGIVKIAEFFDCSADYLLGLSEHHSKKTESVTLAELGLSEKAIISLKAYCTGTYNGSVYRTNSKLYLEGLNALFCSQEFWGYGVLPRLAKIKRYIYKLSQHDTTELREILEEAVISDLFGSYEPEKIVLTPFAFAEYIIARVTDSFAQVIDTVTGFEELDQRIENALCDKEKEIETHGIDAQEND